MLSPRDDDDDDSHLCIKCNATIVGLDNYVKHRKQRCGKSKEPKVLPPIDTLEPTYSLGADVFFQSLELQSSVKKSSLSRLTPPTPITKTVIERKNILNPPSTSRELPRISPLETNLRGEDWIGGHSLRIGSNEDNQTKLINAVASISGAVKKDTPSSSYSIAPYNDYKPDEDSDESEVTEDEEEEDTPHAKWKPPPHYTGGKWRPASPEHEDWDMRDEEHTGGKWKPLIIHDSNDRDEDYDAPPPDHTKGKWVPGAHEKTQIMQTTIQNKGSVQYWCGPCNRRLGSRAIYDKHLMSNLHMRKVLPEHELEFSGHLDPIRPIVDKRTTRPSLFVNDSIYSQAQRKRQKTEPKLNIKIQRKKRNRKPFFVQCAGCKTRVRLHLMGKHLISHYHFRKATGIKSEVYQQLILDNIDAIVHQAPFQCSPCKFYTNWLSNFMQHWFTEEHEQKISSMDGRYWCSFCKFECDKSQEMMDHMTSTDHSDVVAVISRSMPIIIRKKTTLHCETCLEEFRYNVEIKKHCQKTGHELAHTATDFYQELHKCQYCKQKFKCSLTLAAHLKSKHNQKAFFCLVCSKTFKTSEEAKQHRQKAEHRIKRKESSLQRNSLTKPLARKCPYCSEDVILKNILKLKDHIRTVHPNIRKKCPKCGKSFIFSQEVTRHIRDNACEFQSPAPSSSILWHCSQCLFRTDSQAECFFHEILHTNPLQIAKAGPSKVIPKYPCPICSKIFKKASLRQHLRQHTFERPFVCSICGANFTRQNSLANHSKNEHRSDGATVALETVVTTEEIYCDKCGKKFPNRSSLSKHEAKCDGEGRKCTHEGCGFIATSSAQLYRHRRTHGIEVRINQCTICEFSTPQASHMRRHMVCHEGVKPYACPHCDFTCGSLENLRKHVLRSGRHPGLFLYQCRESGCTFRSDTARRIREHLATEHSNIYDARAAIDCVKTLLLKKN